MNGRPDRLGGEPSDSGGSARRGFGLAGLWSRRGVMAERSATVRLFRDATAEAQRSKLPQMAAALSYRTIFGLIPVMVVALIALKFFTSDSDMSDALNRAMQYSGLSSIAVGDSPAAMGPFPEDYYEKEGPTASAHAGGTGAAGTSTTEGAKTSGGTSQDHAAASAQRLDQWIKDLVARVSSINFKAIGLIGLVALIYAAISMLVEVERAFNQIYRVHVGRSWVRRITHYWTLLTLGSIGLFLSFYVGQKFSEKLVEVAAWAGADSGSTVLIALAGYLSTATISTLLFLLVYTVVPNTRVKLGPALAGAAIAALAWEAGKWGFTQYVHYSAGYSRLYGSIALIPLFLLWVYVTWCIVLFGLNVAYFLQYGRSRTEAREVEEVLPSVVDPGAVVSLVGLMAGRFERGESLAANEAMTRLRIQHPIVVQMLEKLIAAGIVNRVQREDQDEVYSLARPADKISAEEVLKVGEDLVGQPPETEGPIPAAMRRARMELVRGKSIAQLLTGPESSPASTPATVGRPPIPSVPSQAAPSTPSRPLARPAAG